MLKTEILGKKDQEIEALNEKIAERNEEMKLLQANYFLKE